MKGFFGKKRDMSVQITQQLDELKQLSDTTDEKLTTLEQQVQKLTRLYYKTSKTTDNKLNLLTDQQSELRPNPSDGTVQRSLTSHIIQQIDDMDIVYDRLSSDSQWAGLLKKWIETSLDILRDNGITETVRTGDTFDPSLAEAVTSSPPEGNQRAYEISAVHKRGFVFPDGSLFRKAHVTTVKEEVQQ